MVEENANPVSEAETSGSVENTEQQAEEQVPGEIDLDSLSTNELNALLEKGDDLQSVTEETPEETDNTQVEDSEAVATEPEAKPEAPKPEKAKEDAEAIIARQQKAIKQQEDFIQRRNIEVGTLKKQLLAAKQKLAEKFKEVYDESPEDGLQIRDKIKEIDEAVARNDAELEQMTRVHTTQKVFAHYIKPGEVELDDMVQCLKDDGLDPEYIQSFAANPFNEAPESIVQLGKRAKAEKLLKIVAKAYLEERAKNQKGNPKPSAALQQIDKIARKVPNMTAAAGTGAKKSVQNADPGTWSRAELDAYAKAHMQRG